jgi:hypothetical protein
MISVKILNNQIKKISKTNTLLDMLLEFERVLEDMNMYAYKNWSKGEILEGPTLKRHFICVKLMYKQKEMPDPEGAKRLLKRGCTVRYTKNTLISPVKVRSLDDLETEVNEDGTTKVRAKKKSEPVWVIDIYMPRRYVDEFNAAQLTPEKEDEEEMTDQEEEVMDAENRVDAEVNDQFMDDEEEQF